MIKQTIAVVFGGVSSEHEVSCLSAASVLQHIDREKYGVLAIGIDQEGDWWLCGETEPEDIASGAWKTSPGRTRVLLSPERRVHGFLAFSGEGRAEEIRVDCVFPVLHGRNGEDGTIQGLLSLAGIAYVGCDTAASAACMDKSITKSLVSAAGVRQAKACIVRKAEFQNDPGGAVSRIRETLLDFPLFVKPAVGGSSVGVSKPKDESELAVGLKDAFLHDKTVLVEEAIGGIEIEVAVLGNEELIVSKAGEIAAADEFYTYDAKYKNEASKTYVPARISPVAMESVREAARTVYRTMGCEGLSRVDFFCTKDEEIVFNEINTLPGFTSISLYPKLMEGEGIAYPSLIDRLILLGLERSEEHGQ